MIIALVEKIRSISTITNQDYIEIVSTYITFSQPRYRCSDCKKKYVNDPEKRKSHLRSMACNYIADKSRHQYTGSFQNKENPTIKYKNCIGNHYYGSWGMWLNYHNQYDKGILPFEGGLMDQPAKFVDTMDLVHNLISESQQEEDRKTKLATRNSRGRK